MTSSSAKAIRFAAFGAPLLLAAVLVAPLAEQARASRAGHIEAEVRDAHSVILNDVSSAAMSSRRAPELGIASDRLQFLTDVDADGSVDRVTYAVEKGILLRTVQQRRADGWSREIPVAVLRNVSSFRVELLDENRRETDPSQRPPRFVRLVLAASESGSAGAASSRLEGDIGLPSAGI